MRTSPIIEVSPCDPFESDPFRPAPTTSLRARRSRQSLFAQSFLTTLHVMDVCTTRSWMSVSESLFSFGGWYASEVSRGRFGGESHGLPGRPDLNFWKSTQIGQNVCGTKGGTFPQDKQDTSTGWLKPNMEVLPPNFFLSISFLPLPNRSSELQAQSRSCRPKIRVTASQDPESQPNPPEKDA